MFDVIGERRCPLVKTRGYKMFDVCLFLIY